MIGIIDSLMLYVCYFVFVAGITGLIWMPAANKDNPLGGLAAAVIFIFVGGLGISTFG